MLVKGLWDLSRGQCWQRIHLFQEGDIFPGPVDPGAPVDGMGRRHLVKRPLADGVDHRRVGHVVGLVDSLVDITAVQSIERYTLCIKGLLFW